MKFQFVLFLASLDLPPVLHFVRKHKNARDLRSERQALEGSFTRVTTENNDKNANDLG